MVDLETKVIAAGSYFVGRKNAVKLKALLGSCVGVAISDSDANVGGLIHLLLPEHIVPGSTYQPEKYASTGLPIFLKALYDKGAQREKMRAIIAGGAIVAPVSRQDINLDIGGRTLGVVKKILAAEGVKIEDSETGGFFTSKLSLDMRNWEYAVELGTYDKPSNDCDIMVPDQNDLSQAIARIQPIPQVGLKILRTIGDGTYDLKDFAEDVRTEQVICSHVLRLCNSGFYGKTNKIDAIDHALVFLGKDRFVKLFISIFIKDFFLNHNQGYSLCMGGLYHHANGTAIIAEQLARLTKKIPPALAYTAGLLHDIGKIVLDQYIASAVPLFYKKLQDKIDFIELEKLHLGVDHTEVGGQLAEKWSFPEALVDTIRHHHYPENGIRHPELTHMVYIADLLMSRFHTGLEIEHLNTYEFVDRFEKTGLPISRFHEIVDLIPLNFDQSF
jgi:putative nucleotidyltransferase with HDIG domain